MDPRGKVALVTGGARIGRTVAEELARRGCDVALSYRGSRRSAEETAREVATRANLDANLKSAYLLALAAAPLMRRHGDGRIVNFADWLPASGRPRYRGYLPYYVSKAGVVGLTESLALELAPSILVNAIAPGPILKPPGFSAAGDREVRKATPLGRWGGPFEIARAVLFLVETEFVTGETLRVDGGRHLY